MKNIWRGTLPYLIYLWVISYFQRFVLKFDKSTCFSKITRKTVICLMWDFFEQLEYESYKKLLSHKSRLSSPWVLGRGSRFLGSESRVLSPAPSPRSSALGSLALNLVCALLEPNFLTLLLFSQQSSDS